MCLNEKDISSVRKQRITKRQGWQEKKWYRIGCIVHVSFLVHHCTSVSQYNVWDMVGTQQMWNKWMWASASIQRLDLKQNWDWDGPGWGNKDVIRIGGAVYELPLQTQSLHLYTQSFNFNFSFQWYQTNNCSIPATTQVHWLRLEHWSLSWFWAYADQKLQKTYWSKYSKVIQVE